MICQVCGQREGTVHVLEVIDGEQRNIWLCSTCAAGRSEMSLADLGVPGQDGSLVPPGEPVSLASFLRRAQAETGETRNVPACPECGYTIKTFHDSNRLGCPQCYVHFRTQILPILARYHRHASHLGKVPRQAGGIASQQGAITRLRVALEKAIQGENYEEAARLRDVMRDLAAVRDETPRDGDKRGSP